MVSVIRLRHGGKRIQDLRKDGKSFDERSRTDYIRYMHHKDLSSRTQESKAKGRLVRVSESCCRKTKTKKTSERCCKYSVHMYKHSKQTLRTVPVKEKPGGKDFFYD